MSAAIQMDAGDNDRISENDLEDAFLSTLMTSDADEPSDEDEEGSDDEAYASEEDDAEDDTEDQSDEDSAEGPEESDEEAEEKPKAKVLEGEDLEAIVKVKVDGQDKEFKVADLTRLAGQEASLTRKTMEVAEKRKQAENYGATYVTALQGLQARAMERYQPFAQVDWLVAAQQFTPEELKAVRDEAKKAHDDVVFFDAELKAAMEFTEGERKKAKLAEAQECIRVLSDPKEGIPGWSEQKYTEIYRYALSQGASEEFLNDQTYPAVFKVLHKAMLYDKAKSSVKTTKVTPKGPKKVVKSSANAVTTQEATKKKPKALPSRLSGDDIQSAFLQDLIRKN